MIVASAVNRAMLRKDFAQGAEGEWRVLRQNLNHIATHLHRPVLPNLTIIAITPVTAPAMTKPDVVQALDQLEASTDRFEEKLKNSLHHSTSNMTRRERVWNRWADLLENSSDNMLQKFKEKDSREFQHELERTLMVSEAINPVRVNDFETLQDGV